MVFLKLEVSWVFAGSPIARCLGPKPTSELRECEARRGRRAMHARGGAIRDLVYDDVDAAVSCDANLENNEQDVGEDVGDRPCCGAYRDRCRRRT